MTSRQEISGPISFLIKGAIISRTDRNLLVELIFGCRLLHTNEITMSRRSVCSRGKDPRKSNISSKFANSPYLNSVQPRQSVVSAQKEKHEKPQVEESTCVGEQPKQSRRRGDRASRSRGRSINTHVPRGSDSVSSYMTHQSIRSSRTRQSSTVRGASSVSRALRIDILRPAEVEKMLIAFSSKHNSESHPLLLDTSPSSKVVRDDETISSASSINDSLIYRECGDEVFSSDLYAKILARDPDQEGPTLTLETTADGDVSDLE